MSFTNFSNGVASFGAPVAGFPITFGDTPNRGASNIFFVNPTTGSDGNTGKRMDKPLASISKAYSLATSNYHDMIILSAVGAHAATDELAVTKNRVHFWGKI